MDSATLLLTVAGAGTVILLVLYEQFQAVPGAAVAFLAARTILGWADPG
ncbi:hypothetical protein [Nocardioides houyundeii]|nr:hypothetical protein [Nocardioides houyundeii]